MRGSLDVTGSYEELRGFVLVFRGEMESLIAISNATFLSKEQTQALLDLSDMSESSARQYSAWLERIN